MEKQEKLVLIDGNSLINRAFYALPLLTNSDGEFSNAVYGFCNILIRLIETEQPKYLAVAFDRGEPTFRHKMFDGYKAGRKKMPEELASQMPILKTVLDAMNITHIEKSGIEADDIIGTLAKKFSTKTIIVSGDRDLFQLVDSTTSVWFTKRGITETVVVTPENIKEVYGVDANGVVELKSLMGDSSDNIKGVAGIGEKTAKSLLETYGSLDGVYAHIDEISGKTKQKLIDGKDDAYLSKKLATINTTFDLGVSLADLEYDFPFGKNVYELFKHYEFNSMLKKENLFESSEVKNTKKVVSTKNILAQTELDVAVESVKQTKKFAIEILDDEIHISSSRFEENIVSFDKILCDVILKKLKPVLEDESIKKVLLNSKKFKTLCLKNDIQVKGVEFDCNLAMYLLSGSKKTDYNAQDFCEKFDYAKENISTCLLGASEQLLKDLQAEGMEKLYFDVELPLVDVLIEMEQNGFKIDIKNLQELGSEYKTELETLTKQIYADAGEEFNIKSPKQLGTILFDKLGLKIAGKKKPSTGIEVLEKLVLAHPIVDKIIRYRKIEKLYSTYVEPFEKMVDDSGLIHTVFNQTLTSTGRLSSSEPNLQNIPVRDEEGKNLRKVFVSKFDGGSIVSSDYSQIELRLLAHYSADPKLVEAYKNNVDIHSQTISDIYGISLQEVTPELRRKAKAVNFGIIYGISEYGLSQNLNISPWEAKNIIQKYFETYSQVKKYMDSSVEKAKELGYVSTLMGRKRKIDEINSSNYATRQFGERAAMNMPLQGTASDIIKVAMIKVSNALKKEGLKSQLILQIHDELIVDCACGEEEKVKRILKENMEGATKLSVPLLVEVGAGKDWFEAK